MLEQGYLAPAAVRQRAPGGRSRRATTRRRRPAGRSRAVLHDLDPAAGRRPLRRAARVASRAGCTITTTIDADLQQAAENAIKRWLPEPRRARRRRWSRSTTTTGEVRAMVGGDDYNTRAVQPRHAGPAPAGLGVQAVRARRGAPARASAPARCGRRASASSTCRAAARSSPSTTTRTRTRATNTLAGAHGVSDNSVFAAGRHAGRDEADRPPRAPDGHPHAGLRATWR